MDCLSAIGIKFGVARSPKDQAQAGGIGLTENSTVKEINEMIDKIGFKLWWWEQQAKEELEKIKSDQRKTRKLI